MNYHEFYFEIIKEIYKDFSIKKINDSQMKIFSLKQFIDYSKY